MKLTHSFGNQHRHESEEGSPPIGQSRDNCNYSRCGRTDRGVSAAGQVVALQLKSAIPLDATWDEAGTKPVLDTNLPKNSVDKITVWVPPNAREKVKKAKDGDKDPDSKKMTRISKQVGSLQKDAQQRFANSLQKSKRRSKLYEENIIKKRKTREEDKAFYEHRTKQEGSAI